MSQVKIQEFIVGEIEVNHLCRLKKGQTHAARDALSRSKWVAFLCERGYSQGEATALFEDAHDVAMLNLRCAA